MDHGAAILTSAHASEDLRRRTALLAWSVLPAWQAANDIHIRVGRTLRCRETHSSCRYVLHASDSLRPSRLGRQIGWQAASDRTVISRPRGHEGNRPRCPDVLV